MDLRHLKSAAIVDLSAGAAEVQFSQSVRVDTSSFHGPRDYFDAARSVDASPNDLRELARSGYPFVRLAVAEHPSAPPDALAELVPASANDWNDQRMLRLLAQHQSAPREVLAQIARVVPSLLHERDAQEGFAAGVALFQRSDVPLEMLLEILSDERTTTEFRKVVARETPNSDVVDHLANDRSERVRRAVEGRPQ